MALARGLLFATAGVALLGLFAGALWRGDLVPAGAALVAALAAGAALLLPDRRADGPSFRSAAAERPDFTALLASPDPVVVVDARTVVLAANEAALTAFPTLRPTAPLAFGLRAPEVLDAVRAALASRQAGEVEFGGRGSASPRVLARIRTLGAGGGGPAHAILFFSDRSRERRVEAMRSDFVATVSHELRTPLASLIGFVDTLAGPARDDARARERFLGIMREQAARMGRLVDDLLQLSRVELHEHVAPKGVVEAGALAAHMAEIMAPRAREKGVAITVAAPDGPLAVTGDRDELLRVLENLIENAIRYGGPGEVRVTVSRRDDRTAGLAVADDGPGIAAEHVPRLTERFYRVDEVASRAGGGTGLGLAIVKHVVARHRGRLSIDSAPGRGTTVRIELPAAPSAEGPGGRHPAVTKPT